MSTIVLIPKGEKTPSKLENLILISFQKTMVKLGDTFLKRGIEQMAEKRDCDSQTNFDSEPGGPPSSQL